MSGIAHVRFARATARLAACAAFYRDVLGFDELFAFTDHDGFDGVMLGPRGGAFHLELTHQRDGAAAPEPDAETLLVLYLEPDAYDAMQQRITDRDQARLTNTNPYWDRNGITIADPDGYRVVICRRSLWGVSG